MQLLREKSLIDIKNHCLANPNEESCGVIVFSDISNDEIVCPCQNINPRKRCNFTIHPEDYVKASAIGKIVGFYHSHPGDNANFSEFDKQTAANHNCISILYHIKTDQFKFHFNDDESNKFIGRPFKYNESDCFNLIKDYYQDKYNYCFIEDESLKHRDASWKKNSEAIVNKMIELNPRFHKILPSQMQEGDLLVFNYLGKMSHFAVYLGNNAILHQKLNKFSCAEVMLRHYKLAISKVFRLQND